MNEQRWSKETYLGDGLYAKFDGYQIILRAPRLKGDHWVALEPAVYASLEEYARRVWKAVEDAPP